MIFGNYLFKEDDMSKVVKIGDRVNGGGNPILIQSMTNTRTEDVEATVSQIKRLEDAGCEIIRLAVPDMDTVPLIYKLKEAVSVPIIFEYFLDGEELSSIMKTLAFDLRTSILQEPEHYILNVKAMYDYSQTNADLANNISLLDNLTE